MQLDQFFILSQPDVWDWNVAVFCQNEQDSIGPCLRAIDDATAGKRVLVCLIVNGSSDGSAERAQDAARGCRFDFLLASIAHGDKANAINVFNYVLRVPARTYMYVDGYVTFVPGAFQALADRLDAAPAAVAATGVSVNGRTMRLATQRTLEKGGVLHGQLHAFRPAFIERMVGRSIRLPIGHYWGDGLLGSMAAHDLDAMGQPWVDGRIAGAAGAEYSIPALSPFRLQHVRRQWRRMIRQARGVMQNAAVKDVIYRENYEGLPDDADDMVRGYIARAGVPRVPWRRGRPFVTLVLRQLRQARRPAPGGLKPRILYASDASLRGRVRSPGDVLDG